MASPTRDHWFRAAMTDDAVVADLLLRLKQSHASPPALVSPPPAWGLRLPRSRPPSASSDSHRKEYSARCSPTTPLSWSGGAASPSADGFEDSSGRSKGIGTNETTSTNTARYRKKKTFAELKDEESLLLKERISLRKEISSLQATCRDERAKNESLKKIKLDVNPYSAAEKLRTTYDGSQVGLVWPSVHHVPSTLPMQIQPTRVIDSRSQSGSDCEEKTGSSRDSSFLLPDLNMMPWEDDSGLPSETLYGLS